VSPSGCEPVPKFPRDRSHQGGRHSALACNQKSRVISPQSVTPISIIDHSEGFSPNSLPSLITYVIIACTTRC
jgi:hypothetical protein